MRLAALLAIALTATPAHAAAFKAELRFYMGRQTIFLNGRPEAPFIYHLTGRLSNYPWLPEAQDHLRDFAQAGYRLFGCETWFGNIWKEDGLDVEHVKRQLKAIRDVRPDAAVLLRIFVEPPGWWLERYPEERAAWTLFPGPEIPEAARVKPAEWKRVSFASERWRIEAGTQLRRLLHELAASTEGDALFAALLCGGEWGEWFYPGFEFEPDSGPAMTRHFRRWLGERYGTDAAPGTMKRSRWRQWKYRASGPDLAPGNGSFGFRKRSGVPSITIVAIRSWWLRRRSTFVALSKRLGRAQFWSVCSTPTSCTFHTRLRAATLKCNKCSNRRSLIS